MNRVMESAASRAGKGKSRAGGRSKTGQALVEGSAILGLMVVFFALLFGLLVQTYLLGNVSYRANAVAESGVKALFTAKWWFGMQRPDQNEGGKLITYWNEDVANDNAHEFVLRLLKSEKLLNEGATKVPGWKVTYSHVWLQRKHTTIARIDFDVEPPLGTKLFGAPTIHATGVTSDAEQAVLTNGFAMFLVTDPNTGAQRGLRIPVYNATNGRNQAAHPTWLRAGKSAQFDGQEIDKDPVAVLRLTASTAGASLHRFHTHVNEDSDGPQPTTIDEAPWTGLPQPTQP